MQITIESIDNYSPHLSTVKALWRPNRSKLGFFPDGAFDDHAKRRFILVALNPQKECIGYLLYRTSGEKITIVHLCVDTSWQRKGVAKKLVDFLCEKTKQYKGINLRCRRDYSENSYWPKLGFVPLNDVPGRGKDRVDLTFWWLDHENPTLFSATDEKRRKSKLCVVIDANIFFDLYNTKDNSCEESQALLADWLQPDLELYLTDEILIEINRNKDEKEREKQRKLTLKHPRSPYKRDSFESAYTKLRNHFPQKTTESDESDIRQLAKTIASDFQLFVTQDKALLSKKEYIYNEFKVSIIRPVDIIIQLDELQKESEYQPARLSGSDLKSKLVHSEDIELITNSLQSSEKGESKRQFQQKLRRYLSDTNTFRCFIVLEKSAPIALIVYGRKYKNKLEIPIFRVKKGPLATTLIRHMILKTISDSSQEQRSFILITDKHLKPTIIEALHNDAFFKTDEGWLKLTLNIAKTANKFLQHIEQITSNCEQNLNLPTELINILKVKNSTKNIQTMIELERLFWPAKIINANIPTFIIPIQPKWAKELFDEGMANQTFFAAKPALALNRENVYYKAKRPSALIAPGRILWYVSHNSNYYKSKHIRACSRLDEVIIGKPKDLFRQFRRLGVYKWDEVFTEVAKKNIDADIMAVRFSDTELFNQPISWDELKDILSEEGKKSQVQSPLKITDRTFQRIYTLGVLSKQG